MVERVALLDAGAQLEKVIIRRVLEQGYGLEKFPANVSPSLIKDYDAIIISGGPRSVNDSNALLPDREIYGMGKPILGICYGLQAISHQLGGKVITGSKGQYGRAILDVKKNEAIFSGLSFRERVLMSHFDSVERIPEGFEVYGTSDGLIAAIGDAKRRIYATQFHPELIPVTKNGTKMFENFFLNVCGFKSVQKRTIQDEIDYSKKLIIESVGSEKHVMHYLSGGVDSTVMAVLLSQCVEPERLHMRTLDTGTMRLGEIEEVRRMAAELKFTNFEVLDVKDRFYNARRMIEVKGGEVLAGPLWDTVDPEYKRKLFGTEYAFIALEEMDKLSRENRISFEKFLLGQGTLRPDVIESGDKRVTKGEAHTIKTHHNAVKALKSVNKLEPLIELFKDQVRLAALELGLSEAFAYRQPFPGPGECCRMIGIRNENIDPSLIGLDERVREIVRGYGMDAHVLPVKTVGVQGDERSYKNPVLVSGGVDWNNFAKLVLELPNQIREINRVLYTPGKPVTLEEALSITPTLMTHDVIRQAQEADFVMRSVAGNYGYNDSRMCSQMPGILIPSNFGVSGNRSFVVRPTWTHDFMAIIGMMPYREKPVENPEEFFPEEMFYEMAERIPKEVNGISRVILDASDKPPASTEWE